MTINRRKFIATTAASFAGMHLRAGARMPKATLVVPAHATGAHMPIDFIGLSYEVQQLSDPAFFSANNLELIHCFKEIALHGVLRLGGNSSEFAWWRPTPVSPEPKHPQVREVEGEPRAQYYPVTPEAVHNLSDFLRQTGWTCIYGIGLGTNTPERAADEAEFVAKTLGGSLQYYQIGNEVDLFSRHLRDPKTWSVEKYLEEWLELARAITRRVHDARFGMPDVAEGAGWLLQIADQWPSIENPPRVTMLSHHYYFGGPPANAEVNISNLLNPRTMMRVQETASGAAAAAEKMKTRIRMTEGNTCYGGGKPGLSDVFAAALWSADYALFLASNQYSGINLHGGTAKFVADSLGGVLPGDTLLQSEKQSPEQIAEHPHPFYTPIATHGSGYSLEPVAYGLKFAALFCGGVFSSSDLTLQLQSTGVNATAYAALLPGELPAVMIFNKECNQSIQITLDFGGVRKGIVEIDKLHASSLDSGKAYISRDTRHSHLVDGKHMVTVPPATGICFILRS